MSTILSLVGAIVGSLLFLFFYWHRLREDYTSGTIFTSGFLILFAVFIGGFLGSIFNDKMPPSVVFNPQGFWFWTALLGGLSVYLLNQLRFHFRLVESFEAASIGGLLLLIFWGGSVAASVLGILLFVLYLFLVANYRKFTWYKSGRVGFAGVLVIALFFLFRFILVLTPLGQLFPEFLAGKVDALISIIIAFCMGFAIYNLSQTR